MPMTTTNALQQTPLALEIRNFGMAVRELARAASQLVLALWTTLRQPRNKPQLPQTALEEANQLRAIADDVYINDPRFAQDLYAAADRHELANFSPSLPTPSRSTP